MNSANIGPRESCKRLRFCLVMMGAGVGLAAALGALHADRLWRLLLFLPFWLAALGWLQAREKT
ncbi:MAG TPA: hypothetical protein VGL70_09155 [Candidatus Binatia bacterium]|jgi:hypothetical protein